VTTPSPFAPGRGPPLVLDGGLATTLEARGHVLDDPLWSAKLLLQAPDEIRAVHRAFLEAGADVIATVSYQASFPGLARRGVDDDAAAELLRLSVRLAREARDAFWSEPSNRVARRRPLVAASVGPYGAFLADGSEYTGDYPVGAEELRAFHRRRWHVLAGAGADLMACETIPSGPEVDVLLELFAETRGRGGWISFSCADGARLADGSAVSTVAARCARVANVGAVGVNCVPPERVPPLLAALARGSTLPRLAYPNSGERWDPVGRRWLETGEGVPWLRAARAWVDAGAAGVGGCCRVGPDAIQALRATVHGSPGPVGE
jgi:homocysteine S-methyltransferase